MTEHHHGSLSDLVEAEVIGHYNPQVSDTIGVIILGFLVFILLVALLRSHARNRQLLAQLARAGAEQRVADG